jgi:AcrR family transcriptional regulator
MPRVRRTQEERSATMRVRLLDAAVATLGDKGYARTTTTEIARRARVSRGAQLHHFPTKDDLVTAAVEHLLVQRTAEFLAHFARLPSDKNRAQAAVELLWTMISGPTFFAWLEVLVAARTDAKLRRTVTPIVRRFVDTVTDTFHQLFPGNRAHGAFVPGFAFAVLQGLALDQMVVPDAPHIQQVLERLKLLGTFVLPEAR